MISPDPKVEAIARKTREAVTRSYNLQLNGTPCDALARREVDRGKAIRPRVDLDGANAAKNLWGRGEHSLIRGVCCPLSRVDKELPVRLLAGPTSRVVDHYVDLEMMTRLVNFLIESGQGSKLRAAINHGPSSELGDSSRITWKNPTTLVEVVASITRWTAYKGITKTRLSVNAALRKEIWELLKNSFSEERLRSRLGGITAVVCASELGDKMTGIFLGKTPRGVIDRLPKELEVITEDANRKCPSQLEADETESGHFNVCFHNGSHSFIPWSPVIVDNVPLNADAFCQTDNLLTGSTSIRGFDGIDTARLKEIGSGKDAFILTGVHHQSNDKDADTFLSCVKTIRDEGCAVCWSYAEPKDKDYEMRLWAKIRACGQIDLISFNAGEAHELLLRWHKNIEKGDNTLALSTDQREQLKRLCDQGSVQGRDDPQIAPWGTGNEQSGWTVEVALFLRDVLDIPLIRVRCRYCDSLVATPEIEDINPAKVVEDLAASRLLALTKVMHPDGLVTSRTHLSFINNLPSGESLAGIHCAADRLRSLGAPESDLALLDHKFFLRLQGVATVYLCPAPSFYVLDGATVSAGDTMDFGFVRAQARDLLQAARHAARSYWSL